ncbi:MULTISPECIES: 23S rRNA (guanosine(2251)-2'-O)-methyltransferase RlmB [unclassified Nitratiruptor]|uniref:23S rRNA (guanosine(2251)-2'-O)-methyltransferase RlmB n=1 Tax=unclassified Nitratiruptor TaxID=2624044 RepID=UPI0019166018|nr:MULTISPECIES: 23S rRNA (guanosine(2251)-2'-O)-methyltransferase RlmB [unclassified Nitratiruptor]BCD60860.1 23S rRNA (guanosine2251-2'-O)-methyltransferase [Nitratiruptor sp. YY08-10]BCD64792.1 23S rRNA (guanosine2251-2'-O)-methyltransferase [Nitratiruptor sp. YY08-14]
MIVYGKQIFHYILDHHPDIVRRILLNKNVDAGIWKKLQRLGIKIERIDNKKAQALAKGGNHQGFLLEIEDFVFTPFEDLKSYKFLVLLYNVTDVGNIGSIIRSAYALGADGLVISGLRDLKMEGVVRRSSGAALDLPIALQFNLHEVIKELQDRSFLVYAADMEGTDVRNKKFHGKRAILLGSEGEGIPKKAVQKCDETLKIVMKREFDSLNVAAAAAIFIDRMRDE